MTLKETFIIADITKTESHNHFIIRCLKKIENDKPLITRNMVYFLCEIDTAPGNHALHVQPMDHSLIC